jgi:RHS repeat-associated protein
MKKFSLPMSSKRRASLLVMLTLMQSFAPGVLLACPQDVKIMEAFIVNGRDYDAAYSTWVTNQEWNSYFIDHGFLNPLPPPPDNPSGGGTGGDDQCNHFEVFDGDAQRRVDDLVLRDLSWVRFHHTRRRDGLTNFGTGGSWRHNWQYDLAESFAVVDAMNRPELVLIYPDGTRRGLFPNGTGSWAAPTGLPETAQIVAGGLTLDLGQNVQVRFSRTALPDGTFKYVALSQTAADGGVTLLESNAAGEVTKVTGPDGRWLKVDYSDNSRTVGRWSKLASIAAKPAVGAWVDLSVAPAAAATPARRLWIAGQNRPKLAQIQLFAPGSTTPLPGVTLIPSTYGYQIDLGAAGASRIGRIRLLAVNGQEATLAQSRVERYELSTSTQRLITRVTASDGRQVSYNYQVQSAKMPGPTHYALTAARYGDGTQATYTYETGHSGPRLSTADDPRYAGVAKQVRYTYQPVDAPGVENMLYEERNPKTGVVYARLQLDPADPRKRTVSYSDERQAVYRLDAEQKRVVEHTDSLGRKTRFEYDQAVATPPSAKIDHLNRRNETARDSKGRTLALRKKARVENNREHDLKGRVVKTADRQNRETTYDRDAKGRVTRRANPDGTAEQLEYNAQGRVTAHTARDGRRFRHTLDALGKDSAITAPDGRTLSFTYDRYERVASVTDPLGRITRFEHDERGNLTKQTAPDGRTVSHTYDAYGRRTATTDEHGRTATTTYDDLGRALTQTDAQGRTTRFDYAELPMSCGSCSLANRPTKITAPDGTVLTFLYDTEGRLLSRTVAQGSPAQATTLYGYDSDNNLTSSTDPLGRITRYTYDDENHRLTQTDALGRVTKWSYDDDDNVVKVTAPDGGETKYVYDTLKRLVAITDAAGNTTRTAYDKFGRVSAITNAAREVTRFTYDAAGRKTATVYADGKQAATAYDAAGRPAKTTSPDGLVTTTTYDAGDRPLTVTRTAPGKSIEKSTYTYDALGHRLTATDPLGRKTAWTYDARGNVLTVTRPDGIVGTRNTYDAQDNLLTTTDAAGATTTYTYDAARNQTSLTDARGSRYSFTYDALRRKTSMSYPDGSVEKWAYDLAGNPVVFTNRTGQTKATAYTAINQPLTEIWTPSPSPLAPSLSPALPQATTYTYNADGRLKKVDNGNAKLSYTYDELGRLASETSDVSALVPGLDTHTVGYRYDALGRRSDLVYPDRTKVSYDYDARSRLTTIDTQGGGRTPLATYAYDAQGRIDKLTRDNGVASTYTYDMAGQLTDITHKNGGIVLARSAYTLDILGRRTAQTREDGITETYGYDTTNQLTSADYGTSSPLAKASAPVTRETFAYDALGNRTQVGRVVPNAPSVTMAYTANALNQYTQVAGVAFTYDANGNLTSDGKQTYRYDAQNRLLAVEPVAPVTGAVRADFAYDARNHAVARMYYTLNKAGVWVLNPDDSRALTYDIAWNLLAERTRNGAQVGEYIHGQRTDEVIVSTLKSQVIYPLADGLGSVAALADDKGKVTERFHYNAYGQPVSLSASHQVASSASGFRFLFTGREWLPKVGLNEHRNRYCSSGFGRWLSSDPIGHTGGLNLYSFSVNSPIQYSDPLGLSCGSGYWVEILVPDNPCFNFSGACANHDACYDKCGNIKETCDNKFLSDMATVCGTNVVCYALANVYYQAVNNFGGSSYTNAQNNCN